MIYIPTHKTIEESWHLSADLWSQVSPNTEGTTKYFVAPREHPETGDVYFGMEQSEAERFGLDVDNAITEWPVVEQESP